MVQLCYLMDGGNPQEMPDIQLIDFSFEQANKRTEFELVRWKLTNRALGSHLCRRRTPLNLSPFFVWVSDDNKIHVDYRLLSRDEIIHPLSFDLPSSDAVIASTSPENIPLETIAFHSFTQAMVQSDALPVDYLTSCNIISHAEISGRGVNIEAIRNHNAKDEASWFYLSVPKIWHEESQLISRDIPSFSTITQLLRDDLQHARDAENIAQTIGTETVTEARDFLQRVIQKILIARIQENARSETLVGVNPLIEFLIDNPDYLRHFVQKFHSHLNEKFAKIFGKSWSSDIDFKQEDEKDDHMKEEWEEYHKKLYECIQNGISLEFLDDPDFGEHTDDQMKEVCLFCMNGVSFITLTLQNAISNTNNNFNPLVARPDYPEYLWCSRLEGQDLENTLTEYSPSLIRSAVEVDKRDMIAKYTRLCEYFLKSRWPIWHQICADPEMRIVAEYVLSKMESFFGMRTVLLKGNHRVQSSFMWAKIFEHRQERWVPEHLQILLQTLKELCNTEELFQDLLRIPESTWLCHLILLPLLDVDLTRTFGRRDNIQDHGARVEHDVKVFGADVHTRRVESRERFEHRKDVSCLHLSQGFVWLKVKKFPILLKCLRQIHMIHFQYLLMGKQLESHGIWTDFASTLHKDHELEILGQEIVECGLHVSSTENCTHFVFGLGTVVFKKKMGSDVIKKMHFDLDDHKNFAEWSDEKKEFVYIDFTYYPQNLMEHYAMMFLSVIRHVLDLDRPALILMKWMNMLCENYFMDSTLRELLQSANLSGKFGEVNLERPGAEMLADNGKTTINNWNNLRGNLVVGLAGALRMQTNDDNKDVIFAQESECVQNILVNGLGRNNQWWSNAFDDYHTGLPSQNRVNAPLVQHYQFYHNRKSMRNVRDNNGHLSQLMNFQRMSDLITRFPDMHILGDLISMTFVLLFNTCSCVLKT